MKQILNDAQRQMVIDHIPFAERMGLKYAPLGRSKGLTMEELQQDARYALCEAALRYKASPQTSPEGEGESNADFQTYAYNWCKKFIFMDINGRDFSSDDDMDAIEEILDDDPEDSTAIQEEMRVRKVQAMLAGLDDKERKVVCLIYGIMLEDAQDPEEPMGFKEVAMMLQLKPARVHQIYEQAMAKMEFGSPL